MERESQEQQDKESVLDSSTYNGHSMATVCSDLSESGFSSEKSHGLDLDHRHQGQNNTGIDSRNSQLNMQQDPPPQHPFQQLHAQQPPRETTDVVLEMSEGQIGDANQKEDATETEVGKKVSTAHENVGDQP